MKRMIGSIRGRVGPLGSALAAAALTAAAFAAVSVAQDGGGSDGAGDEVRRADAPMVFEHRVGPPPGLPAEDREAMEAFRECMEDNGADLPMPPEPRELRSGEPPEPPKAPSAEDREAIEKALEACEDELPEGAHFGIGPCGDDRGDDEGEDDGARKEEGEAGAEMEGAATS